MTWLVGIDEAGYGPNLGPLVMTAIACRVPDASADLWRCLRAAVRRHGERDDGRLLVADSKLVYSTTRGLGHLEKGVLAVLRVNRLFPQDAPLYLDLGSLLLRLCPDATADLMCEPWYTGTTALPIECDGGGLHSICEQLHGSCSDAGVAISFCRSIVVCTPRFNDLTDTCDSKAAALSFGLALLLQQCVGATSAESMAFVVDKHGGRNHYADMLRSTWPGARVRSREEGMERSVYHVKGLDRPVCITFMPRADMENFPVALASMVSKYVREALMLEFNAFWRRHVPGLRPTAGYPSDAGRFFAEIRGTLDRLGLTDRQVWRRR
jgi:ribonuclease HII